MGERIGLSDEEWSLIGPLLPAERGRGCRPARDNRPFFEGMMWIARTGAQWRHLPEEYGKWNSVFRRYRRWATTGCSTPCWRRWRCGGTRWPGRHDRQYGRPGTSLCRGHKKGTGAAEALGRSRGGFTTKLHARCDVRGRPLAFVLTPGQAHDTQGFGPLMRMIADRIDALLADKGYDSDAVRDILTSMDVEAVIPARRNRRNPAAHDRVKYRWRNQVERLFNKLKNWRRVAARYDKTAESYIGFVSLASVLLWLPFVHDA